MIWSTEKDMRLFIINELKPKILVNVYEKLEKAALPKASKVKIKQEDLVAA
jgi:hypothetical protein